MAFYKAQTGRARHVASPQFPYKISDLKMAEQQQQQPNRRAPLLEEDNTEQSHDIRSCFRSKLKLKSPLPAKSSKPEVASTNNFGMATTVEEHTMEAIHL
jgi:hypothetical protein